MAKDALGTSLSSSLPSRPEGRWGALDRSRAVLDLTLTVLLIVLTLILLIMVLRKGTPPIVSQFVRGNEPAVGPSPTRVTTPPIPTEPLSVDGAPVEGSPSARVALIEYSDLQCPYCAKFATETQPKIEQKFVVPGHLRLFFRYMPLETIHPMALKAAEAAACAGQQGHFWQMEALTFSNQSLLDAATFETRARTIGLDAAAFRTCVADGKMDPAIHGDFQSGSRLGVSATPTMFVGVIQADSRVRVTQRLIGAASFDRVQAAIEAALKAAPK